MKPILIYESCGCASCRKAKEWMEVRGLPFETRNILTTRLTKEELRNLFHLASDFDEIVSNRSNVVKAFKDVHGCDLEDLSFNQLLDFLQANPTALRRPILTNGKVLVSGYDEDEMTVLLPREMRMSYPGRCYISSSSL